MPAAKKKKAARNKRKQKATIRERYNYKNISISGETHTRLKGRLTAYGDTFDALIGRLLDNTKK